MLYGVTALGETFQQERLRDIEQCGAPGRTELAGGCQHACGRAQRLCRHPGPTQAGHIPALSGDGTISATPRCMLQ
jgi:hypothetical protein